MMKIKTITLTLFILFSVISHAQDQVNQPGKHEITIGVANLFSGGENVYYALSYSSSYIPYVVNNSPKIALGYKYNSSEKLALRTGFNAGYRNNSDHSDNSYSNKYSNFSSFVFIGVEHIIPFKKTHFFFGLDLYNNYQLQVSDYTYPIYENSQVVSFESSESENVNLESGIAPFLGVEYFLTPRVSLSLQSSFLIGWYESKSTSSSNLSETYEWTQSGFNSHFMPGSLLCIHIHL